MFRSASLFIGTSFTVAVFTIFATSNVNSIVGIPHKIYLMQRILFPHKKPISLLNVPICTQGVQRTWWSEAGSIIVTGPNYRIARTSEATSYYLQVLKAAVIVLQKPVMKCRNLLTTLYYRYDDNSEFAQYSSIVYLEYYTAGSCNSRHHVGLDRYFGCIRCYRFSASTDVK